MKHKQRKFTARTALISALAVSVLASAAAFLGASAAENAVSPTDVARSTVSRSDASRRDVSRSDAVELTANAQAEPKVMEEAPESETLQVTLTTGKASGETMSLTVLGENLFIDWGDGEPVAVDGGNTDGPLGDGNVRIYGTVTSLNCNSQQLTALDVSKATALWELVCYDNNFTSLDLSANTSLTILDCGYNPLKSIDLSHNTALEELYCVGDGLSTIDLSHNPNLEILDVGHSWGLVADVENTITTLDLSHNPKLGALTCIELQLSELDVSHNPELAWLEADGCQLKSLDVSNNPNLQYLVCCSNQLTSLDVSKNPNLDYLDCSYNQLTTLDLSQNAALTDLYCDNNKLMFSAIKVDMDALTDFSYHTENPNLPESVEVGQVVDLSAEETFKGKKTVFTWYDDDDNEVTPTKSENGVFTFGEEFIGKSLYCAMTNEAFPDAVLTVNYDNTSLDQRVVTTKIKVVKATPTTTTTTTTTTTAAESETDNDLTVTGEEESVVADAGYSDDLKVTDEDGEVVPVGELQLIVSDIDDAKKEAVLEAIERYAQTFHVDENNTALYDISLVDNNKAHVTVENGKITVCLKYPDNLGRQAEKYTYKLYHQKADGTIEEIPVTCKANGIWFEATDFSPYALAWNVSTGSPGTGESNVLTWIAVILALLSLAGAGAVFCRRQFAAQAQ